MKQDDSAKTTRMELAKAFIENLPFEECHIDLLPAVAKYVETGDESEFKSFTEFQLLQTTARKEKDVENAKKKIAKLEEYQKEFQRFFDEYQKWYDGICAAEMEKELKTCVSVRDLYQLCKENVKNQYFLQKHFFVLEGDKLVLLDHVSIMNNKIVFTKNGDYRLLHHFPMNPTAAKHIDDEETNQHFSFTL